MIEQVQTKFDIIKATDITSERFDDLARALRLPPPCAICDGVPLYPAYTSNYVAQIMRQQAPPVWVWANAPLIETVNVQTAARFLETPVEVVVKAVREGRMPSPALESRTNVYWFSEPFVLNLDRVYRSVHGLRRLRRLTCDICFNAVFSAVGSKLNLERNAFDARLLRVSETLAKWQIDTEGGVTYLATSDATFTVRFLIPINAACNEFA